VTYPATTLTGRNLAPEILWARMTLDAATGLAVPVALYAIFVVSPAERVQGEVFRIFYLHISMAWLAYLAFLVVFVGSLLYLLRRQALADQVAHAAAEVGVVFTTFVLMTGVLWGRPVWGVWWTWDARLTTTLVLWFIYVGYLMLRSASVDPERAARTAGVVGVIGFVNVPVVQLSVTWWRTLHPEPSVTRPGALPPEMTAVLVVALVAFTLVFVRLVLLRLDLLGAQAEVERLTRDLAERSDA
jgi:heme exporter protein C